MKPIFKRVSLIFISVLVLSFLAIMGLIAWSYFHEPKIDNKKQLAWIEQNIQEKVVPAVTRLKQNDPSLTDLEISYTQIGDKGAKAIAEALKTNIVLEHLMLIDVNMGIEGLEALEEALKTNTTLQHLNLDGNMIGHEIHNRIDAHVKRNQALKAKTGMGSNSPS